MVEYRGPYVQLLLDSFVTTPCHIGSGPFDGRLPTYTSPKMNGLKWAMDRALWVGPSPGIRPP